MSEFSLWHLTYQKSFQEFRDKNSKLGKVKGIPQGGSPSPLLFNFYFLKFPAPPQADDVISYADDCSIMTTGHTDDNTW